ncbi:uncharacterized protein Z520_05937 [Fonsecaea multimorphosa CBS 102226]|uniref:Alpha/beta hydrolase fold-3 domain-containing protein n=1 Tax=Fonsecaea multimorphosa CBS 102226 TaxID=1442371 RepID=A0A0D2INN1_9EURO|nr:uncharacterized protein Z520_05937 [Fonsecaea multimorphosa CBS 102226]KIX98636.1 hypothetical protein Z520_05937 [Fonsecaea multimorphosa CBS 102226]OAL24825.1 hypothetical protein AYO22_05614 [Fonsecaea multimorphosa]
MTTIPQVYRRPGQTNGGVTFLEKLDLIPAIFSIVCTLFRQLLSGPFRGERGTNSYRHHVTHGVVRKFNNRLTTSQWHYISKPFRTHYQSYCKVNSLTPQVTKLKNGTEAFWIGSPTSKRVIVYFHGGGFSLDGGPEHLKFWGDLVRNLNADSPQSVAILFLAYTLVPYATYPTQISEAVEVLKHLFQDMGRSPSTISLGGDSAGANMCVAVLSHLLHPCPELPSLSVKEPLNSLILVGPWISFRVDFESGKYNATRDIISISNGRKWSTAYMNGAPPTPYAEAFNADPGWWKGAETKVKHVLCVAGSDELLIDVIKLWVEKYKSETPEGHLELVVGRHEAHIAPIFEPLLGDSSPTQQGEAVKAFLKAKVL